MRELVLKRMREVFAAWAELAEVLPDEAFAAKLPVRSNCIGSQFWCLVGARESYTRAIARGAWDGFACSLTAEDVAGRAGVAAGLASSAAAFDAAVVGLAWDEGRETLLLSLLEHEVQHQGQLIRYLYGLGYTIPESWKKRWSLS